VVDEAYRLGGGTSIYESSPLQRRFRDVHAATQHMLVAPATWELTGRLLLGLPTEADQL
jgi:alkylation response protein AidB-like acyl-CoA dehydrogenase